MAKLRVKEVAKKKGISMGKLSRAADVDMSTLRRVYDDTRYSPTLATLEKLARNSSAREKGGILLLCTGQIARCHLTLPVEFREKRGGKISRSCRSV